MSACEMVLPAEQAAEKTVAAIMERGERWLRENHVPLPQWPAMFQVMLEGARAVTTYGPAVPLEQSAALVAAVVKAQAAFGP